MKFATTYSKSRVQNRKNNIGETIIDLALDEIYRFMGIPEDDIIKLDKPVISSYDGEPVILPIVKGHPQYHSISKAFTKNVIPVFLCWSLLDGTLNPDDIDYLKAHEPIGCRDEHTLSECQKYGIKSYFNGCITICFPRLKEYNKNGKVYLVDVQPELEKYIPESLKKDSVRLTHLVPENNLRESAKKLMSEYANSARLVITSRLHAAIPCAAMGIPVILAKNDFPSRYTWCDRIIPVYDHTQYDSIDWNPSPPEFEEYKNMVLSLAATRLKNEYQLNTSLNQLNKFYSERPNRKATTALSETIPCLEKVLSKYNEEFSYSIWGVSVVAESIYQYMKTNYPKAKLIHVYDKYRVLNFHGILTESSDNILRKEYGFLIACPMLDTITLEMESFLKETNQPKDSYIIASHIV